MRAGDEPAPERTDGEPPLALDGRTAGRCDTDDAAGCEGGETLRVTDGLGATEARCCAGAGEDTAGEATFATDVSTEEACRRSTVSTL